MIALPPPTHPRDRVSDEKYKLTSTNLEKSEYLHNLDAFPPSNNFPLVASIISARSSPRNKNNKILILQPSNKAARLPSNQDSRPQGFKQPRIQDSMQQDFK